MLELLGSEYVIDHVVAEHNARMKEEIFRCYVCDVTKIIAESWGAKVNVHYSEMIIEEKEEVEKTGDEIVLEVIQRIGLKVRNDESI